MMNLTAEQKQFLGITDKIEKTLNIVVENIANNISNGDLTMQDLENNFKEVFMGTYQNYLNFLKDLRNNTEVKEQLKEEIWNELQGV